MDFAVIIAFSGLILASGAMVVYGILRKNSQEDAMSDQHTHTLSGELLVTGDGEVVIEHPITGHVDPERDIKVRFKDPKPPCPPCVPVDDDEDELSWELVARHRHRSRRHPGHHHETELFLKIFWSVDCERTVCWSITQHDHGH